MLPLSVFLLSHIFSGKNKQFVLNLHRDIKETYLSCYGICWHYLARRWPRPIYSLYPELVGRLSLTTYLEITREKSYNIILVSVANRPGNEPTDQLVKPPPLPPTEMWSVNWGTHKSKEIVGASRDFSYVSHCNVVVERRHIETYPSTAIKRIPCQKKREYHEVEE